MGGTGVHSNEVCRKVITILIPVLKTGYLESQLHWLDQQTYKEFTVIAMDVAHHQNKFQSWAKRQRSFNFIHVPLVHNIDFPKRCDYSIKNNLAFLAPTDNFLFLSDTHYPTATFVEVVANACFKHETAITFEPATVLFNAFDPFRHTVDVAGQTTHVGQPVFVFDRRTFFYVLNGFDEALTCASSYESMALRVVNLGREFHPKTGLLYHILHNPDENGFGRRWKQPCEKCDQLFSSWKFDRAYDTGDFPMDRDQEQLEQLIYRDRELGIQVFQCHNCGFGGVLNPAEYQQVIQNQRITGAPDSAFEGRTGRNLGKIYEQLTKQVANDVQAKLAYLMTTY